MGKQSKISQAPPTLNFGNQWIDHPWVEWLSNNKQIILWALGALFAFVIIAYRILTYNSTNAEADFFTAQTDFTQFQESAAKPAADAKDLRDLETLMARHPELHGKYDAQIAQTLLIEGQLPEANTYAQATFKRTADDSIGLYHEFAATSLLIQAGKYPEALAQSQALKEKMDASVPNPYEDVLYVYNAIRLGLLNQQQGLAKESKQVWDELRAQALKSETALAALQLFRSGQASFDQFVEKAG